MGRPASLKEMVWAPRGDRCLHPWIALATNSGCARLLGQRIPDRAYTVLVVAVVTRIRAGQKLVGIGVMHASDAGWRARRRW